MYLKFELVAMVSSLFLTVWALERLRSASTTLAQPSLARSCTMARLIPDAAPVTRAKPGTPRAVPSTVAESSMLPILFVKSSNENA